MVKQIVLLVLVCVVGMSVGAAELAGRRPNIIVILTDDQGYGDASCTGNPILKTPNIDRLYREGRHFDDFMVSPTCAPTRCSLMTGRHEFKSGVTHTILERERMSLKATTIAQILKSAGYSTGIFGKWHLGDEDAYQPENRGFDEVFIHGCGGIGQQYPGTSCGDAPGNMYQDPVLKHNGKMFKAKGYCTDLFFNEATTWIESRKDKGPFLAWISPNAPHAPLQCPPEYEKLYAGKVSPLATKFFGMLTNIDDNIGKLLNRLTELKLDENTLVIFMNDNGGTVGVGIHNAGMHGSKNGADYGSVRAMSIWRMPGTIAPGGCDRLAAHIDVFPTLAALAGAKVPEAVSAKLEGFSLVPLLEDPSAGWHEDRTLFTHVGRWDKGAEPFQFGLCSVRWQQYLMVRQHPPRAPKGDVGKWALYDLKADVGQTTDLAADKPEVIAKLRAAYDKWWEETLPGMDNEQAYKTSPKLMPFFEQYYKQFPGAGPNNITLEDALKIGAK